MQYCLPFGEKYWTPGDAPTPPRDFDPGPLIPESTLMTSLR